MQEQHSKKRLKNLQWRLLLKCHARLLIYETFVYFQPWFLSSSNNLKLNCKNNLTLILFLFLCIIHLLWRNIRNIKYHLPINKSILKIIRTMIYNCDYYKLGNYSHEVWFVINFYIFMYTDNHVLCVLFCFWSVRHIIFIRCCYSK